MGEIAAQLLDEESVESRERASRTPYLVLLAVVLLFVSLASVVAFKTQLWDASDEPGHVVNIETIAGGHWYGFNDRCHSAYGPNGANALLACTGDEAHQAPLYYLLMAGWQEVAGLPVQTFPQNWHVLIRSKEIAADQALVYWLRFGNVLLAAATVVVTFFAARVMTRDRWTPVIAAATLAFLPIFLFHAAYVNNDNLVNLLGASLTFCVLQFVEHRTVKWMIFTGVTYGLMLTTKLSTIPIGLIIPILVFLVQASKRRIVVFLYGSCSALAVSAWYLIQNWVRYGDPLGLRASKTYLEHVAGLGTGPNLPYVIKDPIGLVFVQVPRTLFATFWYNSGWWNGPSLTVRTGAVIACVVAIVLLGLLGQSLPKRPLVILAAIAVLSFACVWVESFQTASYTARVALVGISAMAIIVALALQRWSLVLRWLLPGAELTGLLAAMYHNWISAGWPRL